LEKFCRKWSLKVVVVKSKEIKKAQEFFEARSLGKYNVKYPEADIKMSATVVK
jgi:hypothetical protein